jgi:hypothetical protein
VRLKQDVGSAFWIASSVTVRNGKEIGRTQRNLFSECYLTTLELSNIIQQSISDE